MNEMTKFMLVLLAFFLTSVMIFGTIKVLVSAERDTGVYYQQLD